MDLLYVAGALILCATILVLQRIVYPRATCGIFTRVSMLFILSSVWIIFKVITKEPVVTIAVVSVFFCALWLDQEERYWKRVLWHWALIWLLRY